MDWAGSTRSAPLFAFGVNFLFQSFSVSVEISLMDWWSELSIQDRWKLVCSICGVSYGVCIQVNYSWLKLLLGWSKHVITLSCIIIVFSSYLSRCISPSLRTCCWSLCWGTVLVLFFLLGISFLTINFLCFHQHVFPLCGTILLILAWRWWQNLPHITRWRWGSLYSITLVLQKTQTTICWTSISRKWPCWALSVGSDRYGFIIWLCKDW